MPLDRFSKRRPYATVLCYHGFVGSRGEVMTFREQVADLQGHVEKLLRAGYTFVLPGEYLAWRRGEISFAQSVAMIQHDDGLDSLEYVVPWLIGRGIPCGIAVIARRQGKFDPEGGYLRWSKLHEWVRSGLVEICSHTYNFHSLTLFPETRDNQPGHGDGGVYWNHGGTAAPILEGPCWIDDGDPLYIADGDTRWYWDFSHVDRASAGLPLFGSDPYDGRTPIVTSLFVTPRRTGLVKILRLWMSLSAPSGAGYDAQVQIRADGLLVWDGVIQPQDYETRSQWPEREFLSIALDQAFQINTGQPVTLEFATLSAGPGAGIIYALLSGDEEHFRAVTNCRGLYPAGSQESERFWQYIDYPAGDRWPVTPAIILGFGDGRPATDAEYADYVRADCRAFNDSVNTYLTCEWAETKLWEAPWREVRDDDWAEWYPANQRVHWVQDFLPVGWHNPSLVGGSVTLSAKETLTIDCLKLWLKPPEFFTGGEADPFIYRWGSDAVNRSYPAVFRFSIFDAAHNAWRIIGDGPIWTLTRGLAVDVEPFTINAGETAELRVYPVNPGPTVGAEQCCRWPVEAVLGLSRTAGAPAPPVRQIVYPFGAYRAEENYYATKPYGSKDIHPVLREVFEEAGLEGGYTIQAFRNAGSDEFREPPLRFSDWCLGRWLAYGDQPPAASHNNLLAYSGLLWNDVKHRGVEWQVSLEADEAGCATIRHRPQVLDYVAFDAWYFDGLGKIKPHPTNDGGSYWNESEARWDIYPDDKARLQACGVKCLLILNNNAGTGEPSAEIGAHVFQNPDIYIPQMLDICRAKGWDGITCNIEEVGPEHRAAATVFYRSAARAFHDNGFLLHATVPAITGTDYDAEWWMGWCDLAEVAAVCDAVKVMSYTETGPHSAPGPAAPDWFWQAAYAYVRRVVPEMFWPRILCGCRAFGHYWRPGAEDGADYVSYHEAIGEALLYGASISVESTEGTWTNQDKTCWFGTPLTVDRSQKEAADNGFGGLGLWKLDDGDVEEFFPAHKQIGRDEDMSFIDVRFPEPISFGSGGGPKFDTTVVATKSGDEYRASTRLMPLYEYDISLKIQTRAQYEAVRDLFMVARGKARSFRFKDWADYRLDNVLIGLGDGESRTFQCVKAYAVGAESLLRRVTKPVAGSFEVFLGGVRQGGGFTVNYHTGLVSLSQAPAAGVEVRVAGEFDVPVRFDMDYFPAEIESWGDGPYLSPGSVKLIEVRR
ncbi:MAG: TIGR02217 family protein [Candidatus Adiutrix sp.]|jgi:uncharacterized protein (TIGR02217 family)|nr:TIGR02217 family protein [Candidatus Adiutrix sp.]